MMLDHSSLSLSLLCILLHCEVSLLKIVDVLSYFSAPLGITECSSLPSIDVNIAFRQTGPP